MLESLLYLTFVRLLRYEFCEIIEKSTNTCLKSVNFPTAKWLSRGSAKFWWKNCFAIPTYSLEIWLVKKGIFAGYYFTLFNLISLGISFCVQKKLATTFSADAFNVSAETLTYIHSVHDHFISAKVTNWRIKAVRFPFKRFKHCWEKPFSILFLVRIEPILHPHCTRLSRTWFCTFPNSRKWRNSLLISPYQFLLLINRTQQRILE